ncbi:hypothetical protein HanHA300_Chr11g0416701 [Helianthus annuus]|nr:hypothetical protein HanHA300_Chr11g0416701 [Helianthus annuus]KAJ0518730.1 hypothetical protein HanHA89_Chr11g0440731 [Helianthus annuus]
MNVLIEARRKKVQVLGNRKTRKIEVCLFTHTFLACCIMITNLYCNSSYMSKS